ncbi:hypothetical protein L1987_89905 [Smallanthus sonchifolius]|nr:hypothetical protein L1987_89905 [Smallanthus sonchifolius]
MTDVFVNRLFKVVEHTTVQDPHPGLIIGIGIINSTSAVPGAAERDALAVEAKKGIEPWLPPPSAPGDPPVPRASFASILAGTSSSSPAVTKLLCMGEEGFSQETPRLPPASTAVAPKLPLKQATSTSLNPPKAQDKTSSNYMASALSRIMNLEKQGYLVRFNLGRKILKSSSIEEKSIQPIYEEISDGHYTM